MEDLWQKVMSYSHLNTRKIYSTWRKCINIAVHTDLNSFLTAETKIVFDLAPSHREDNWVSFLSQMCRTENFLKDKTRTVHWWTIKILNLSHSSGFSFFKEVSCRFDMLQSRHHSWSLTMLEKLFRWNIWQKQKYINIFCFTTWRVLYLLPSADYYLHCCLH